MNDTQRHSNEWQAGAEAGKLETENEARRAAGEAEVREPYNEAGYSDEFLAGREAVMREQEYINRLIEDDEAETAERAKTGDLRPDGSWSLAPENDSETEDGGIDGLVVLGACAAAAYGLYRGVRWLRRKRRA